MLPTGVSGRCRSLPLEKLSEIPGVGAKIAEKLVEALGSEEETLRAITNSDAAALAAVPGLGHGKALRIIRSFYEAKEGVTLEQVMKTQDTVEIYEHILSIIRSYARTEYASDKLSLYFPLLSSKIGVVEDRISRFSEAERLVEKIGNDKVDAISKCLARIHGLKRWSVKKQLKGRLVITDSDEILKDLEKSHVSRYRTVRHLAREETPPEEEASFSEDARGIERGEREGEEIV